MRSVQAKDHGTPENPASVLRTDSFIPSQICDAT
jgi:hypothetical protein